MQIKDIDARLTLTGDYEVILTVPRKEQKTVLKLMEDFKDKADKVWEAVISVAKQKRSNTANGKAWLLLGKIAKELSKEQPISAEEIYKEMVPFCSEGTVLIMKDEAVEKHIHLWEHEPKEKIGWSCKILGSRNGYTEVLNYYGSSCFDTVEMHKLLTLIVQECKQLNIETLSPDELERLVQMHGQ
ncbi:hypothetical protein [Aminipila sp.]|uniref:hypothetical protein n=1 Tax=Aminipila sp. TaxID=2060095 RepID=UPI002896BD66|nr:hypothetical protein [Aminipila sp.]